MFMLEESKTELYPDVLTVKVLSEDIMNGKRCDTAQCPIALALRRAGYKYVSVGAQSMDISFNNERANETSYTLSDEAQMFVLMFDLVGKDMPINDFVLTATKI